MIALSNIRDRADGGESSGAFFLRADGDESSEAFVACVDDDVLEFETLAFNVRVHVLLVLATILLAVVAATTDGIFSVFCGTYLSRICCNCSISFSLSEFLANGVNCGPNLRT